MADQHQTPRHGDSAALINEKIPYKILQLISHDGKNLGRVTREDALRLAREEGLDLVILSEKEDGPVAKIMDFGRASYAKKKQQASARKKQRIIQVKEIQLGPKIGDHDFDTKMNRMVEFLKDGKHVKIVINFRGREVPTRDARGTEMFEKIDAYLDRLLGSAIQKEKDAKAVTNWSRVYYVK
jgi:translation initiation factor IF-3